jgi:predicted RNase H-like HicB family nuclease
LVGKSICWLYSDAMKRKMNATVWQEGDWFVAQCLEVDVDSQGATEDEALANLHEDLELHFEEPHATLLPRFGQSRWRFLLREATSVPRGQAQA